MRGIGLERGKFKPAIWDHELQMITLTIDDKLGRQASQAAAARGKTLEEFVGEALRQAISDSTGVRRIVRNGIPVMLVPDGQATIDPDRIRRALQEEGH